MYKYVLRRLLMLIPTLFGVILIVFSIMEFLPGDPARLILGDDVDNTAIEAFHEEFGLDRPYLVRFGEYIFNVFTRFDFGKSWRSGDSVVDDLLLRLPKTLTLAVLSTFSVVILGVPLGVLASVKRSTIVDSTITVYAMLLSAVPTFWIGLMLLYLFGMKLGLLPTYGADTLVHFILPVVTLSFPNSAPFIRLTRVNMLETVNREYVRTARAKGAPEPVVIWKHAFKNAVLPLINSTGLTFGRMLGGTVIIENIFSISGVGRLIVTSINQRDIPVVMGCSIFLAITFMLIVLIIDLLYAFVDPRIRAKFSS